MAGAIAGRQRSALAVGDRVEVELDPAGGLASLLRVLPRRSVLRRTSPERRGRHREHVIAANVDRVVVVASAATPPLREGLIDRALIAIEGGGAHPALCINQCDRIPDAGERARLEARLAPYAALGIPLLWCAAPAAGPRVGIDDLARLLTGETAVFVGQSGVGKSSLINALDPELALATGPLARAEKGRHTTTGSCLYRLRRGTHVIDTPGIREFGLWQPTREQLADHFRELAPFAEACRFRDCRHRTEPGCAVREALERGELSPARFESFQRLADELEA